MGYGLMWADRQIPGVNGGIRFPAKYDNRHKLNIVIDWKINKKMNASIEQINCFMFSLNGQRLTVNEFIFEHS